MSSVETCPPSEVAPGVVEPARGASTALQTAADLESRIAHLYMQRWTRDEISELLDLRVSAVGEILAGLFALGMPSNRRRMTEAQLRAIYRAYLYGASIDKLAEAIGFTGSGARRQLHRRRLPLRRRGSTHRSKNAGTRDEHELITGLLLLTRIDELRRRRGLTIEDLAQASGLSLSALKYMRAHLSDPKLSTVLKLCRGLGVTPCELVEGLPVPTMPCRLRSPGGLQQAVDERA
jgi:DNA-binding Xre family transcriptional regulator